MKVAISQERVIFGGRIKILLGISEALNQLGITPVWITDRMPGSTSEIRKKYGSTAEFSWLPLRYNTRLFGELARVRFNRSVANYCQNEGFDWIINSSNTVQGFTESPNVISYIHFPREARAASPLRCIHTPKSVCQPWQAKYWQKVQNRVIFSLGKIHSQHRVLANSRFSLDIWRRHYKSSLLKHAPEIIYPFADVFPQAFGGMESRRAVVSSLGRFCEAKRQFEQVRLACKVPDLEFWLMGHINKRQSYFEHVRNAAATLDNVDVLPNLLYTEVRTRLSQSRYFLHSNVNEPFGITTVEAILSGCVPLVHDSGGQREVVPIEELRFQDLDEIPPKLAKLESSPVLRRKYLRQLRTLASQDFVKATFVKRFSDYFLGCMQSESAKAA